LKLEKLVSGLLLEFKKIIWTPKG